MRMPRMDGLSTFDAVTSWAKRLSQAISDAWGVEHGSDGTHKFDWIDVQTSASMFGATDGMTWDVTPGLVYVNRYRLVGNTMHLNVEINNADVGVGGGSYLTYTIPGDYRAAARMGGSYRATNAGTVQTGWWVVTPNARFVRFAPEGTWTATAANNTTVIADMAFEVTK